MVETLEHFESVMYPAAQGHPLVALASGGAAVAAGLFMWLGGLGFKKVLMAMAGAASGFAAGYFVIGRGIVPAVVAAGAAAGIAILLERAFIALLAAILAAGVGFVVLVGPYINTENPPAEPVNQDATANNSVSLEQPGEYLAKLGSMIGQASDDAPVYKWCIVGLLAVIALAGGFVFRRLAAAVCFSVLGTLLIAGGMGLLLLYKGSTPLSWVGEKPLMYGGIAGSMMAFGTLEQLLICRGGFVRPVNKAGAEDGGEGAAKKRSQDV